MTAIIQHSKNLVLYYGYHTGVVLLKASNSNDVIWIDFEDFVRAKDYTWCINGAGYAETTIKGKHVLLHRFITKARDGVVIDHKNLTKLDNRKYNLREASKSQNQYNRGRQKNNTSGLKGVRFNIQRRKWHVKIGYTLNGIRMIKSEFFASREEAGRQYNEWARQYHGQFACVNEF